MSVARFIADQRTFYRVPHAVCCAILGVSTRGSTSGSTGRPPAAAARSELDAEVARMFEASERTYGSPRIHADLLEAGLVGQREHRRRLDAPARSAGPETQAQQGTDPAGQEGPEVPGPAAAGLHRVGANVKWCGDITEIPTDEGKLYLATVLDLFSRRLLACPTSEHSERGAGLRCDQDRRRGPRRTPQDRRRDLPHRPRLDLHRGSFTVLCKDKLGVRQSMGRVGSCFDNAAAESFFSTLEHEVLSRHHFTTKAEARTVVLDLVPRLLQHPPSAQLGGDDVTQRVRTQHRSARPAAGSGLMDTKTPVSDVSVTAPGCPSCGRPLPTGRSRRFCSPACRQAAYRRRHQRDEPPVQLPPQRSRLHGTVYQCPECETRYLAEQWCHDCSRPCQRLSPGGTCPSCEETITIQEITEDTDASNDLPASGTPIHH